MGRQRVFTDSRLQAEYNRSPDPLEIAKRLDTTPTTVYRHLARLGLRAIANKRDVVQKFTDQQVLETLASSKSLTEAAMKLGSTTSTMSRYAKRLGIEVDNAQISIEMAIDSFHQYKGDVTLANLADRLKMSPSTVQSMLLRASNHIWENDKPSLPKPWTVLEIKIFHLIQAFGPDIATQPDRLPKARGLTTHSINRYLDRAEPGAIAKARADVSPIPQVTKKILKKVSKVSQ